ncbi:MAG: hypothetical protein HKN23_14395 [Verrucomicrobiales bacterium]|nr:hypothetical protein [Verrucomicrobiales bacterium]
MKRPLLLFLLACFTFHTAVGQTDPGPETPAPDVPATPDTPTQPAPDTDRTEPAVDEPEREIVNRERSIYVPFEDLEAIFEQDGRGVFLPYREFLDLWNQINLQDKKKDEEKPPTDGVLASAQYTAAVEGDENQVLAIDAVLTVESFKEKGWAVVPLLKAGMNIAEAETGEATLHLGKNGYELILPNKGQYEIKLKLYAKVNKSSGRHSVGINLPKAGVSKFEAIVPDTGWEFDIQPGAAYTTQDEPDGTTKLSFFFGETEHFDIGWQKQGEETKLTPLLFVETDLTAKVVPGALQTDAVLNYRILRAGVDSFEVTVPGGQEVLSVAGENIKEWDVSDMGDSQRLLVSLHSSAKQSYTLRISLEEALDALPTEFDVPRIAAENVVRQRGTVSVKNSNELELETVADEGLTQQSMAGAPVQGNVKIAPNANVQQMVMPAGDGLNAYGRFRFLTMPFTMTLSVKKAEPVVEVESWTRFVVEPDSANFIARFDYSVKRVGIFDTRIQIPAEFEGVEATGPNVEDFSEETVDGNRFLNVKFNNRALGNFSVTVTGRMIRENAADDATVPVFSPQDVERHEGKIGIQIHTSLDPSTEDEGDLRQQDVNVLGVSKANNVGVPGSGALQIGFRYRAEAAPAVIGFTLKKPQVNGEVFTLVEVKEQLIRYQWTISYNVLYAGVDTFIISVPESIAENLRHDGTLIKEVDKNFTPPAEMENPPEAGDGRVLWGIILRDKKMGSYQLKLTLDEPLVAEAADDPADAPDGPDAKDSRNFEIGLPEIKLEAVDTETGQVAVVKDDNLEILDARPVSLESIDPKELRGGLARPGVFLSYKYRRHPIGLTLDISRNEFLPVPQAVVTYANLTSVVSSDEAITTEVIYWVKNNAKQFFSVSLPENGKMVSDIYVNGQPQQPMRRADDDAVLIRLPVESGLQVFPVRFVYEVPSDSPGEKLGAMGGIEVKPAELTDAEVLQSHLKLYLPEDYVYRSFKSAMRLPVRHRGWNRFRNAFSWLIPSLGPQLPNTHSDGWEQPPQLPPNQQTGFDIRIPTEGRQFDLHRLDAPDTVKIGFRSQSFALFWEALLGLAALVIGLLLLNRDRKLKLIYFAAVGLGSLIIAGAVAPTAASIWQAIYLGVFLGALVWIAYSILKGTKRGAEWLKKKGEARAAKRKEREAELKEAREKAAAEAKKNAEEAAKEEKKKGDSEEK